MGDINRIYSSNIFPGAPGGSIAERGTGGGVGSSAAANGEFGEGEQEVAQAIAVGGQANPLIGLLVFGGAVALVGYVVTQAEGAESGLSNLKGNMYNALMVSGMAVAGIPVWKYLFTRVKVPGVSTWVQAV